MILAFLLPAAWSRRRRSRGRLPDRLASLNGSWQAERSFLWLILVSVTGLAPAGIGLGSSAPDPSRPVAPPGPTHLTNAVPEIPRLEVAHAVIVTVELDWGSQPTNVAEALNQIERRSKPVDGVGRTFALLDAYGEPTPEGKLHLSMHISAEKPGLASLVFKRTGAVLWQSQIVQGSNSPSTTFANRGLIVLMDNGAGHTVTVDGSKNPRSILEAGVKEMGVPVADIWPEGAEREISFLYSACGCPVKVLVMRLGDRTVRTREMPILFPDDPAVLAVIKRLMGWN
jgi:hypothetical protein